MEGSGAARGRRQDGGDDSARRGSRLQGGHVVGVQKTATLQCGRRRRAGAGTRSRRSTGCPDLRPCRWPCAGNHGQGSGAVATCMPSPTNIPHPYPPPISPTHIPHPYPAMQAKALVRLPSMASPTAYVPMSACAQIHADLLGQPPKRKHQHQGPCHEHSAVPFTGTRVEATR